MTGKFVQQQMYTRERGGIFHATDGYDTIAISEGLDQAFVKKYLHPFCIYHSPKTLAERGEKDTSLYPEAVTLFQPETGDLAIGQAVFVPADFTGTRSTYFMHNYIIPPGRKDEWIKQPEKLFQLKDFKTSYDIELGKVLPEKDAVSYDERDILFVKNELLKKLGISEVNFKQLLFAVMSSIAGKKKVFISLNVPLQDYTKNAMQLLELIYLYLPYAHRRKFGAMTFSSEPESKNYIHVMFFEPGTLNAGDRSIEKQFIFDFAGSRISGVDIEGQQHEYLEYAIHHFSESKRIDDFLEFAEMALSGLPEEQKLELSSYYQLTAIYLALNFGNVSLYKKIGFLHSLLKFLQVKFDEKSDLVELFLKLLRVEKLAADPTIALDYINAVVSINKIVRCDEALSFILETLEYYQNNPLFHKLWMALEQDKLTYQAILMFINEHPDYEELLELYLNKRFKQVVQVEDILNEIKLMLGTPYLLGIEKFKSVAINKVASAISNENDPFKAVLAVKDFSVDQQSAEFSAFQNDMLTNAKLALLRSIRLKELTIQDVMAFGKIFTKELNVKDTQDVMVMDNYLITNALYQLISSPAKADTYDLKSLSGETRLQLRSTLRQLLQNSPTSKYFPLLFIAFEPEIGRVDYPGLLDYLIKFSDNSTMLSFIHGNAWLIETDRAYKRTLKKYLISSSKSIWLNKTTRKELKNIQSYSLKKLLKEVEAETASPLVKFLKKNGLKLTLVLVILAGVGGGSWMFFGDDAKPKSTKTSGMAASGKKTPEVEGKKNTLVSFEQFTEADPGKAGQASILNLNSKHVKNIIGQARGAVLTDINGRVFQLEFKPEQGAGPFDQNGVLKNGYSLFGTEYDFDAMDDTFEVVLFARDNKPAESYLWVYSIKTNDTIERLTPILKTNGVSSVKLDGKKLILQMGVNEMIHEYSAATNNFSDPQN